MLPSYIQYRFPRPQLVHAESTLMPTAMRLSRLSNNESSVALHTKTFVRGELGNAALVV